MNSTTTDFRKSHTELKQFWTAPVASRTVGEFPATAVPGS
jgi:uncharacterized PurR-regulated membrane protein YhhQ (DUF165 family)